MSVLEAPFSVPTFRERRAQARVSSDLYAAPVVAEDTMIHWLALAAKQAREAAGRKQVHVAAAMDKNQSTVYRFEQGLSWPRDTELFVAAYAEDLDLDPLFLWESALELWRTRGARPNVRDLLQRRGADELAPSECQAHEAAEALDEAAEELDPPDPPASDSDEEADPEDETPPAAEEDGRP